MSADQSAEPESNEPSEPDDEDWLDKTWESLPARSRTVLTRRLAGETLDNVALPLDLTRERVRQLQVKAEAAIVDAQKLHAPELPGQLAELVSDQMAVPDGILLALLPAKADTARSFLLRQLGVVHPRVWAAAAAWILDAETGCTAWSPARTYAAVADDRS